VVIDVTEREVVLLKVSLLEDPVFSEVFGSMDQCTPLYKSNGGLFGYKKLNYFLTRLEVIGDFYESGTYPSTLMGKYLSSEILRVASNVELKTYVENIREQYQDQQDVMINFYKLAAEIKSQQDFTSGAEGICPAGQLA